MVTTKIEATSRDRRKTFYCSSWSSPPSSGWWKNYNIKLLTNRKFSDERIKIVDKRIKTCISTQFFQSTYDSAIFLSTIAQSFSKKRNLWWAFKNRGWASFSHHFSIIFHPPIIVFEHLSELSNQLKNRINILHSSDSVNSEYHSLRKKNNKWYRKW